MGTRDLPDIYARHLRTQHPRVSVYIHRLVNVFKKFDRLLEKLSRVVMKIVLSYCMCTLQILASAHTIHTYVYKNYYNKIKSPPAHLSC